MMMKDVIMIDMMMLREVNDDKDGVNCCLTVLNAMMDTDDGGQQK